MSWIFKAVAVVALLYAVVVSIVAWCMIDDLHQALEELKKRVNINDEVITLHSEEIDELQRIPWSSLAVRMTDMETRMMELSWEAALKERKAKQ